jgi:cell division protein ZapD
VRLLLRLEDALRRVAEAAYESSPDSHRSAMVSLCDLVELTTRIDLKAEVRSEAERQRGRFRALRGLTDIDEVALDQAIDELEQVIELINVSSHRAGARCREDGWLSMVRARVGVAGGLTRFDMPSVNFWLALAPAVRQERLIG